MSLPACRRTSALEVTCVRWLSYQILSRLFKHQELLIAFNERLLRSNEDAYHKDVHVQIKAFIFVLI